MICAAEEEREAVMSFRGRPHPPASFTIGSETGVTVVKVEFQVADFAPNVAPQLGASPLLGPLPGGGIGPIGNVIRGENEEGKFEARFSLSAKVKVIVTPATAPKAVRDECASHWEAGFIQNVIANTYSEKYSHGTLTITLASLPILDGTPDDNVPWFDDFTFSTTWSGTVYWRMK
jgi:hypothetical protein